jgi:hypothetical protein
MSGRQLGTPLSLPSIRGIHLSGIERSTTASTCTSESKSDDEFRYYFGENEVKVIAPPSFSAGSVMTAFHRVSSPPR